MLRSTDVPFNIKLANDILGAMSETTAAEQLPVNTALTENAPTDTTGWLASLRTRFGIHEDRTLRDTLEDALKQGSEGAEAFSSQERDMLSRILRFGALRVEDVMVPRADIVAVDEDAPISELVGVFVEAGHSRIPLYRETLDDLRGMVHIKDLVAWMAEASGKPQLSKGKSAANGAKSKASSKGNGKDGAFDLAHIDLSRPVSSTKLRREALFVPLSMPAVNLMLRMQSTHVHLAIVVDEYGGTDGLVSIEDLVEEIVGAIEDEHDDTGEDLITEVAGIGLVAEARTPIEELEAYLNQPLLRDAEEEDIDTIGGLVFSLVGRVPVRGELVRHPNGIEFEVLDADPRRIKKLKVHRRKGADPIKA